MDRKLLGMLTPSSNTRLEPLTTAILADLPEVTAHFARFRVTEISLNDYGLDQFGQDARMEAALLLADAKCDVIAWNGTSAGWLGFEHDEVLCERINRETGAASTSSILANNDLMRRNGITRFGLVTPYTDDVQSKIIANYAAAGFDCVAERHLGITDNFSFSEISPETLADMCRSVARAQPQVICVICTNLFSPQLAEPLEKELGVPIYDSTSVVVLRSLELAGCEPSRVTGWGQVFGSAVSD